MMARRCPQQLLGDICHSHRASATSITTLPFLYQTRTLSITSRRRQHTAQDQRYPLLRRIATPDRPRHYDFAARRSQRPLPSRASSDDVDLDIEARIDPSDAPRRRDSTITATERDAFGRIFDDIIASHDPANIPSEVGSQAQDRADPSQSVSQSSSVTGQPIALTGQPIALMGQPIALTGNAFLDAIFSEAMEQAKKKKDLSFGPTGVDTSRMTSVKRDASGALSPAALLGMDEPSAAAEARLAELKTTEDELRSTETDLELWAVLQKKVFPLVQGLGDSAVGPGTSDGEISSTQVDEGEKLARLATVCSNYPHLLLVAFRLLSHDFNSPATCRALFAHIKALGPVSHVLGASTALFHEMIDLSWRAYRDPAAVADLLHEMDRGGLELDEETGRLLTGILRDQSTALKPWEQTPKGTALWELDAFRAGMAQLTDWRRLIGERREERASSQYD